MEGCLYVTLSGQRALQQRLDTIANNVANASTPGFRAEGVAFEAVLSRQSIAYANAGRTSFSMASGPVVETGNPLDVAVDGDAFLMIRTPGGDVLTRDGRMRVSAEGELETMSGHAVLDQGGAPIRLDPSRGPVAIGRNGAISQKGGVLATLGLFRPPQGAKLVRGAGAGLVPDKPAEPVTDFANAGVVQGYSENSNVNPILEMTRLISVSRAYEDMSASNDRSDRQLLDAIKALGEGHR